MVIEKAIRLLPKRIGTLIISAVYYGCRTASRALARLLLGRSPDRSPVVLTYHAVKKSELGQFERQMRKLVRRTTPVFADEDASAKSEQSVAVTFDDAFQTVVSYALPVLAKYRIPATIFVPTGFLGTQPGWITDGRRSSGAGEVVISAETVRTLDRRQVRIGSHTVTHPRLAGLQTNKLCDELIESRRTLEGITHAPVTMLALPYGSFDQRVLTAAGQAGYDRVFANVPVKRRDSSAVQLAGRVNVTPQDWRLEFDLKIQGAYGWMALAVPAKRDILRLFARDQEL